MSRCAVSTEHFPSTAHLLAVSLPSKPSRNRLSTVLWRADNGSSPTRRQNSALAQHRLALLLGRFDCSAEARHEPGEPFGDIERALLRAFERLIITIALTLNLGRHAVESLPGVFRLCQRHIGDRSRDASVPVIERVDGHDHRCARLLRIKGSISIGSLNQAKNASISAGSRLAGGAS